MGLFSRAFQLYTSNFATITKIALGAFLPASVITGLAVRCLPEYQRILSTLWNEFKHRHDDDFEPVSIEYRAEFFFLYILYYLGYLIYCFAVAATLKVASDAHAGGMDTTLTSALDIARHVFPQVFIAGCVVLDLSLVSSFFLILPGIFLYLSWWLTFPSIVSENLSIFPAMKRSWNLSDGYRLDLAKIIFAYLTIYALMFCVVYLLLVLTGCPHWVRQTLGFGLPVLFIQPAVCVLQSVVYFDLSSRYEVGPVIGGGSAGGDDTGSVETNPFAPVNMEEPLL